MPKKLKVLITVWYVLVGFQLIIASGFSAFFVFLVNRQNPNPTLMPLVILWLIIGALVYGLLSICRQLSKGQGKYAWVLKVYGSILLISIPIGTVVGVLTWVLLGDKEVKEYLKV